MDIKIFDFKKIMAFIKENRQDIMELAICIPEDCDNTWDTIIHNGNIIKSIDTIESCSGIKYTCVGTPAIYVKYYGSDLEEYISAYYEGYYGTKEKRVKPIITGCLMAPRINKVFKRYTGEVIHNGVFDI